LSEIKIAQSSPALDLLTVLKAQGADFNAERIEPHPGKFQCRAAFKATEIDDPLSLTILAVHYRKDTLYPLTVGHICKHVGMLRNG
jgi:hypothetical protein